MTQEIFMLEHHEMLDLQDANQPWQVIKGDAITSHLGVTSSCARGVPPRDTDWIG